MSYVKEGAEFTAEILRKRGWDEDRIRLCFDAIERHHELRSQWERGPEVELIPARLTWSTSQTAWFASA